MGCTTCSGNPNTWCTQCMPAEDTWVAPVDKLPDVFMGDRDHMYLLPNGDLYILSPDRTRWIKVNGQGGGATYDDTKVINRLKALEGKTDNFISSVNVSRNGNRVKLTYTLVDGTIKEVEFEDKDTVALAYDDSALKARVKALEDKPVTPTGVNTFFAKGDISGNGNSQNVRITKDKLVNADTIKVGDTVVDSYWDKNNFNIGMFKVASVDGNNVVLNGVNDLTYKQPKQSLTLADRTLSISEGNSVTLPNDKQTISRQGNKLVLSNGGGEVDLPTPNNATPYDDSFLRGKITALENKSDNDKQTLTLEGKKLSISNGNSVMLPEDTIDGGDNLICNSGFPTSTNGWGYWTSEQKNAKLSLAKHAFYYNNTENMFVLSNNTQDAVPASSIRFKVKRNTNYSLNLASFATSNIKGVTLYFLGRQTGEKQPFTNVVTIKDTNSSPSTTGVYNFRTTFNTGNSDEGYIRIDNKGTNNSSDSLLFFSEVDVYEGTSPRSYSPSVKCALDSLNNKEDKDKQTLTLNNNVLSISNGNSVTLPAQGVSTQDFNNLKNEYNKLKDAFTALLQNLKNSGAWNQTGNTIFEGSLRPDRNIATGNINLFGGTVDGNAFIRTNNGKTENDLAGGIN